MGKIVLLGELPLRKFLRSLTVYAMTKLFSFKSTKKRPWFPRPVNINCYKFGTFGSVFTLKSLCKDFYIGLVKNMVGCLKFMRVRSLACFSKILE